MGNSKKEAEAASRAAAVAEGSTAIVRNDAKGRALPVMGSGMNLAVPFVPVSEGFPLVSSAAFLVIAEGKFA